MSNGYHHYDIAELKTTTLVDEADLEITFTENKYFNEGERFVVGTIFSQPPDCCCKHN